MTTALRLSLCLTLALAQTAAAAPELVAPQGPREAPAVRLMVMPPDAPMPIMALPMNAAALPGAALQAAAPAAPEASASAQATQAAQSTQGQSPEAAATQTFDHAAAYKAEIEEMTAAAPGPTAQALPRIAIVAAKRTSYRPFGLASKDTAKGLAAQAVKGALASAGMTPADLEKLAREGSRVKLVLGSVDTSGNPNIGREVAVELGMKSVPGTGVCKNCGTSLESVAMGASLLRSGAADVVVAGGAEAMSQFPQWTKDAELRKLTLGLKVLPRGLARTIAWVSYQYRRLTTPLRYAITEGLAIGDVSMAGTAQTLSDQFKISRERQDWFAFDSQRKAAAAAKSGQFADELLPSADVDGGIRFANKRAGLAKLKPVLGTKDITAANASQMTDGASAVVMMREDKARELGLVPLGYLSASADVGVAPETMGLGPAYAIPLALKQAGKSLSDMAVIHINEAFAAQTLAVLELLGLKPSQVNPQGGAIARGHPLAASGAGLVATTLHAMRRQGGLWGLVAACIGGGEGQALVLSREPNGLTDEFKSSVRAGMIKRGASVAMADRVVDTLNGLPPIVFPDGTAYESVRYFVLRAAALGDTPAPSFPEDLKFRKESFGYGERLHTILDHVVDDMRVFGFPSWGKKDGIQVDVNEGIATIALNQGSANTFTESMARELDRTLNRVANSPSIKAVVITGRGPAFSGGADLSLVGTIADARQGAGLASGLQGVFAKAENMDKPVVMALNGVAVGGGLEFAMSGHYRVASGQASFGLPEVKLGLLPGAGGTQRLPRLVGLTNALFMMNTGETKDAYSAKKLGLVDEVVAPADVLPVAQAKARGLAALSPAERTAWLAKHRTLSRPVRVSLPERVGMLFHGFEIRRRVRNDAVKAGHPEYLTNLMAIVDAALTGVRRGPAAGLAVEARSFGTLAVRPLARFITALMRRQIGGPEIAGVTDAKIQASPVERVGVVGAGVMGAGLVQLDANSGLKVSVKEHNETFLAAGLGRVRGLFDAMVKKGALSPDQAEERLARVSGFTGYPEFAADPPAIVVEAIPEKESLKVALFQDLGKTLPPSTVLASNTSALSITKLAQASGRPERFVGLHYFNPPHKLPLVEIVLPDTAGFTAEQQAAFKQTLATALAFMKKTGRIAVVVHDAPGFVVNRMLLPYGDEGARLLEEGATIEQVDGAMRKLGFPMGPLQLADFVGLPLSQEVGAYLERTLPHLGAMSKLGGVLLAKKDGFHDKEGKANDAGVTAALSELGIKRPSKGPSGKEVEERLLLLLANEGGRILDEGVASSAQDIDIALTAGAGFPTSMGGLMRYVSAMDPKYVVRRLQELAKTRGSRYEPAKYWLERAAAAR